MSSKPGSLTDFLADVVTDPAAVAHPDLKIEEARHGVGPAFHPAMAVGMENRFTRGPTKSEIGVYNAAWKEASVMANVEKVQLNHLNGLTEYLAFMAIAASLAVTIVIVTDAIVMAVPHGGVFQKRVRSLEDAEIFFSHRLIARLDRHPLTQPAADDHYRQDGNGEKNPAPFHAAIM